MTDTIEIQSPKKNLILDSQILSSLMGCGRKTDYHFNHNLMPKNGKKGFFEMGSIVHTILENYYKNIIKGLTRQDAVGFALIAGQDYISTSGEVKNSTEEDIELTFDTMHQYFQYYKNDSWTPLEVECVKGKVLYEDDEIRILYKAKFDLISDTNQAILPVDHKTMKMRRDSLSLNNQFMGQCVLAGTRQMIINKVGFQKTLKPNERFTRSVVNYTFDRLLEWQSVILPYWSKIYLMYEESGYWPPNFTHCDKFGYCIYKDACESDRGLREESLANDFVVGKPWDITTNEE